jgi:radical SAM-linked protein
MMVVLEESMAPESLLSQLRDHLPEGFEITGCKAIEKKSEGSETSYQRYHVELRDGFFTQKDLDSFIDNTEIKIEKKNKKGKSVFIDLKNAIGEIELLDRRQVRMSLGKDNQQTVRPAQVLRSVFHLSESQILTAVITKKKGSHV